jgi:hypothetical protein
MSADPISIARSLAAAHPNAKLACPVCAVSLKAENLDRHLAKVHASATASSAPWPGKGFLGLFPCSLAIERESLILHHRLGLARRIVALPCHIEAGSRVRKQGDAIMSSYSELNNSYSEARDGRYLRLTNGRSITVGCKHDTMFTKHWDRADWTQGRTTRRVDIVVDRAALVGLEYALAERGMLRLAP